MSIKHAAAGNCAGTLRTVCTSIGRSPPRKSGYKAGPLFDSVRDKHAEYEADRNHSQQTSAGDATINSVKVHLAWNAYRVVFIAQVGKLVESSLQAGTYLPKRTADTLCK